MPDLLAVLSGSPVSWRDARAMDKPILRDGELRQGQSPVTDDARNEVFDDLLRAANALQALCEHVSGLRYHLLRFADMLGAGQDSMARRMDPLPVVEDCPVAFQEQRAAADTFPREIHHRETIRRSWIAGKSLFGRHRTLGRGRYWLGPDPKARVQDAAWTALNRPESG